MKADVPIDRVLAAIVPAPRLPADEEQPCCAECFEERARRRAREDWRNSRRVEALPARAAALTATPNHGRNAT